MSVVTEMSELPNTRSRVLHLYECDHMKPIDISRKLHVSRARVYEVLGQAGHKSLNRMRGNVCCGVRLDNVSPPIDDLFPRTLLVLVSDLANAGDRVWWRRQQSTVLAVEDDGKAVVLALDEPLLTRDGDEWRVRVNRLNVRKVE